MLTTASQLTPGVRSVRVQHAVAGRALAGIAATCVRQRQQTRAFRWGIWSGCLDDDFRRELRRRHRQLMDQHPDSIKQRLSWEKYSFAEVADAQLALKRLIKSHWLSPDRHPGARYCDNAEPKKQRTPANENGVRPGRNIEDVERGAMDHLMFGDGEQYAPSARSAKRRRKAQDAQQKYALHHKDYDRPVEQGDFIIDPITNRKIAKKPAASGAQYGDEIPVKTFKAYRSQFDDPDAMPEPARSEDYFEEDALSVEELRRYGQAGVESDPKPDEYGFGSADHRPQSNEDMQSQQPAHSKYYFDESRLWDKVPDNRDDADLHKHRPVEHPEPNVEPDPTTAEHANHSDQHSGLGRHKYAVGDSLDHFEDLKPPYEDLDRLESKPLVKEATVERFDNAEHNDAKKHQLAPDVAASAKAVSQSAYDSLDQSFAVRHDHFDGEAAGCKGPTLDFEAPRDQQSFTRRLEQAPREDHNQAVPQSHTATKHQESHGMPSPSLEYLRKGQPVLDKYAEPTKVNGSGRQLAPSGEGLGQEKMHTEAGQYWGPFLRNEADGKPSPFEERISKRFNYLKEELDSDQGSTFSNDKSPATGGQATSTQNEKSNYREMLDSLMETDGRLSDAVDREASLAVKLAKTQNQQNDRLGDSTVRKLTGNYVRDFPEEFEKSWTQFLSSAPAENAETTSPNEFQTGESMDGGLEGAFGRPEPVKIQPALDRHVEKKAESDHLDQGPREPHSPKTSSAEQHGSSLSGGPSSAKTSTPAEEKLSAAEGPSVAAAQSSSLSGSEQSNGNLKETIADLTNGPTLYRILAYDSTMQNVNIAETTSLIPDFTSALSPTDALLRLSHPMHFFPHFARLEQEGFEIVSGSGDVLIFRKARPSTLKKGTGAETQSEVRDAAAAAAAAAAEPQPELAERPVNPIDMTGRPKFMSPASANFASPTGYVTYENLPENEASNLPPPPPPRVKYNIDLRREEPVFSGPKYRAGGGQKRRQSIGKRLLVGGVWVAGISYGLGVVSEYFNTGGSDGLGPTGF